MTPEKQIIDEYIKLVPVIKDFGNRLLEKLEQLFAEKELSTHSISGRLKEAESLRRKISLKKYGDISEVTDLLGIRVILYFRNELELACQIIEDSFIVDEANSSVKRPERADSFGYESVHYVLNVPGLSVKIEIQVRTILQHAWAEIAHDRMYKGESIADASITRRFFKVAALLETADTEFVEIRRKIAETQRPLVPLHIQPVEWDRRLEVDSLKALVLESRLIARLDLKIAETTHGSLHYSKETIERLSELFLGLKLDTTKKLERKLFDSADEVIRAYLQQNKLWHRYLDTFPEKHGNPSSPKGTCLTYLHFVITGKALD